MHEQAIAWNEEEKERGREREDMNTYPDRGSGRKKKIV
jgi:hypothetical protein